MAEVSKMTADRLALGSGLVSAVEVQGETIAAELPARLGVPMPRGFSLAQLLTLLVAALAYASDELRDTDLANSAERTDDAVKRSERDETHGVLRDAYHRGNNAVRATFGDRYADQVGFGSPLQGRPDLVVAQVRNICRLLETTPPPAASLRGARIDVRELARDLAIKANRTEATLLAVKREERKAQQTLARRDEAMARWERTYAGVSNVFIGLCQLAGREDLASKVKPTARRRSAAPGAPTEAENEPSVSGDGAVEPNGR